MKSEQTVSVLTARLCVARKWAWYWQFVGVVQWVYGHGHRTRLPRDSSESYIWLCNFCRVTRLYLLAMSGTLVSRLLTSKSCKGEFPHGSNFAILTDGAISMKLDTRQSFEKWVWSSVLMQALVALTAVDGLIHKWAVGGKVVSSHPSLSQPFQQRDYSITHTSPYSEQFNPEILASWNVLESQTANKFPYSTPLTCPWSGI